MFYGGMFNFTGCFGIERAHFGVRGCSRILHSPPLGMPCSMLNLQGICIHFASVEANTFKAVRFNERIACRLLQISGMLRLVLRRGSLLLLALLIASSAAGGRQTTGSDISGRQATEGSVSGREPESTLPLSLPHSAVRAEQTEGPPSPPDGPRRGGPPPAGTLSRRKREESVLIPTARKRSYCRHGLGRRMPAYSFGLGKRAPYSFGLGKRAPYSFGLGKRAPYSFGLGKRTPYSFGLGKRRPYSFGLGKRSWSSWFDGPTRDMLKRPSYSFGLGKRAAPASRLWETRPGPAGVTDTSAPVPVPAPQVQSAAGGSVTPGDGEDCQDPLQDDGGVRWREMELPAGGSDTEQRSAWQTEQTA